MLILTRKPSQRLVVGTEVLATVLAVNDDGVTVGIQAPRKVPIRRAAPRKGPTPRRPRAKGPRRTP